MKTYLDPELNIVKFSTTDIIMASGSTGNNTDKENWNDYSFPVGPPPH